MQINGTERARATLSYLRRKITTGEWPIGERIPIEPELAQQMSVGRSTVREAVRSLANMGMLETLPGRGTFVRSATPTSALLNEFLNAFTLEEVLSYRRALEIEAAQQATIHRTAEDIIALKQAAAREQGCSMCPIATAGSSNPAFESQFHLLMFDAAKNRLLAALYAGINEQLRSPQHRGKLANITSAADMEHYHQKLITAIEKQDFIDAVHAMAAHVDHDIVIVTPEQQVVPALARTKSQQDRIKDLERDI
ncbi:GntR family transcriptional regulator [Canibacter sp. lx-72]|uniref:FadR/GntR family transcriptional regulator n=1 Tax=Canibacter zhuwentaonis TaxID=2837491 RepID=UPI001BDD3570|nr:GntR family transcriptional regulator [Canibacter zhuwentaonis]MBT1018580.1 GntR family transcriptional regulator [Canibacter zhuwentaonis]MBT1035777.1 GntR family transcriptional regulator [Canibacter zhuwentaonis]